MLGENEEAGPSGSDLRGLLADLLEAARQRNLSANSVLAYERTWRAFIAWAAAAGFDPRALCFPTAPEAYRFLGARKSAPNLKQMRAALSFVYKHWDVKNPFAKIDPPLHKEPQIRYLLLADIRRLLDYLKARQQAMARLSRSICPTLSSRPPAGLMNLSSSPGPIARQR